MNVLFDCHDTYIYYMYSVVLTIVYFSCLLSGKTPFVGAGGKRATNCGTVEIWVL